MSTATLTTDPKAPAARKRSKLKFAAEILAGMGAAVLVIGLIFVTVGSFNAEKEAFEQVLQLSGEELQEKSVKELNEYRSTIKSLYYRSDYSTELMARELKQVEALILEKTAG